MARRRGKEEERETERGRGGEKKNWVKRFNVLLKI